LNPRALVIAEPGRAAIERIAPPDCSAGDVLIRSCLVGLCGTDLKILRGDHPIALVRYPCIPGHEWSGIVDRVEGPSDLVVGDRVTIQSRVPCGRCARCSSGETNLCVSYDEVGFTRPGGCAELVAVPARVAHRLPDRVGLDRGALVEPAATVVRAFERAGGVAGRTVGVVGAGAVGSIAILVARFLGANAVVAYGRRPTEIEAATRLGANAAFPVQDDGGGGLAAAAAWDLDIVVEAAGAPEAIRFALGLARPGGTVLILGTSGERAVLELPADRLVRKDLRVHGILSYTTTSFVEAIRMAAAGLRLERIVASRLPLTRFQEAFSLMQDPGAPVAGRIMLETGSDPP
jgi:threonine dehydrogenase-like Zn-dependent dehydrogenase